MRKSLLPIASLLFVLAVQPGLAQEVEGGKMRQAAQMQADSLRAQVDQLQTTLSETAGRVVRLEDELGRTSARCSALSREDDALWSSLDSLRRSHAALADTQRSDSESVNSRIDSTDSRVEAGEASLADRTAWGMAAVAAIVVAVVALSVILSRRIRRGTSTIDEVRKAQQALGAAQTRMQEESVKLDSKLLDIAARQMEAAAPAAGADIDHSLALKVADEVVRIELNLSRMDQSIRGYKQLSKAVQRIKDNFAANGYEIVEMLGKPYDEGMKVTANFVPDETLEQGAQVITGITKPQVNYNGRMIQAAQITVSQNI